MLDGAAGDMLSVDDHETLASLVVWTTLSTSQDTNLLAVSQEGRASCCSKIVQNLHHGENGQPETAIDSLHGLRVFITTSLWCQTDPQYLLQVPVRVV